jgi:translocation and assembly module TamB
MPRAAKIVLLAVLAAIVAAVAGGIVYVRSDAFRRFVLAKVVEQMEQTTGGRVEVRSFNWSLKPLQLELEGLVIHGHEPAGRPPLLSADDVVVQLRILSLFRQEIDWRLFRLTRPAMHISMDAEGRSNVPQPKVKFTGQQLLDRIWELKIKRAEVTGGVLVWNDGRFPLDFAADNVAVDLSHREPGDTYLGNVSFDSQLTRREHLARLPASIRASLLLHGDTLGITGLTVTTPRSMLTATGQLAPLIEPKIELSYSLRLDASEAARLFENREVRDGLVAIRGKASYNTAGAAFSASGDLRLERFSYHSAQYDVARADASARFALNDGTLDVPWLRLAAFGGELTGRARIESLAKEPLVTASGQVGGFSVARLLDSISTPAMPFSSLGWVGAISGTAGLELVFVGGREGARNVRLHADLHVQPPTVTPPAHVPLWGEVAVAFAPATHSVTLQNLSLQTPASRLSATGNLDLSPAGTQTAITVNATVTSLTEWQPLLAAVRPGQPQIPLQIQGQARFQGTLRGALSAPLIGGRLEALDFTYLGRRWNRFTGNISYSPDLLRVTGGQLASNGASAQGNLSAGLVRGRFTGDSPVTLDATLANAPLADLQSLAGTSYPLDGLLNARVRVAGTKLKPRGTGSLQLARGSLLGEPFDTLHADLLLANGEVQANSLVVRKGPSAIAGQVAYREADRVLRFQLAGDNISLNSIQRLPLAGLHVSGTADFRASGEGTLERPSINADLRIANLAVSGEQVGNVTARVETREAQLQVRAETQLLRGTLLADATIRMEGDFPGTARLQFSGIDVDPLLPANLRSRLSTHSVATGLFTLSGPFSRPEALTANAELTDLRISPWQAEFHGVGPLRASYANGVVNIEQAHVAGTQTDLAVLGTIRLTGPPASRILALRVDGSANMALLNALDPNVESSGQVLIAATVNGPLARPLLNGRAEFRDGNLSLRDFSTGLSSIRGTVIFDAHRLQIQNLTAQVGGGLLRLSGFVNYAIAVPPVFQLGATAQEIRIRYPQGTSALLDAKLQLTGTTENSQLSGEVVVRRARFEPQFDLARALGLSPAPMTAPAPNPILAGMRLDLHVISAPEMSFEFAGTRNVQLEANLRARGTAARPALLGHIGLLAGEVTFAGTQYDLNRGDILFVNPFRIDPQINLSLSTRIQQYNISIDLNGPLDRLNVAYRSDPPLPANDVQMLLITGQTPQSATAAPPPSVTQLGANTILSQALNMAVGSRIERIFGVSRLKIDPQVGGPETNPGARVTLQQQVTKDVRFTYITNLSQTQQQVIQVDWQLDEDWSVQAVRDQNGLFGIDLRWRKRFR